MYSPWTSGTLAIGLYIPTCIRYYCLHMQCLSLLLAIMPSRTQVLILLMLTQVWSTLSQPQFEFELEVDIGSVTAGNFKCATVTGLRNNDPQCSIYFEVFCLREGRENFRSTNESDCPLGRNTMRMNTSLENQLNTRRIASQGPWPVRASN